MSFQGLVGALLIVFFGFLVRHRLVATDRRNRLIVQPDLRHDRRHAAVHLPGVFLLLGHTSQAAMLTALTVAAVVCIAASNGGTTSQDLKTGYLVGATPYLQQYAILIGALTSALVMGLTLLLLNRAGTVYTDAP